MNKQPFYHCGYVKGEKKIITNVIKSIKTVIRSSVEYFDNELLFTATSDVSIEANELLKKNKIKINNEIDAEAGNPDDLM